MPLPLAAPDRDTEAVEWLVDVGGLHFGTRTYAEADYSWIADTSWIADLNWISGGAVYLPSILSVSDISRELDDAGLGWTAQARVSVRIANHDGSYNALWSARGLAVTIRRRDRIAGVTVREFEGVVDVVTLDAGASGRVPSVEIEAFNQDQRILDAQVPKRVTSTTLFGATCPTPGVAIPKIVGTVPLVPLIHVVDDVPARRFEHLIGEGTYTVAEVRRDRIGNQQPQLLDPSEYDVVAYSGLTVIRTDVRQIKGGGGFHQLYATVSGPAAERNPATFAGLMLGDTTWGAGLTVDEESVSAAAALIPAGLVIDGVLRDAKPAREWLQMLLELRGGRPTFSASNGWGLIIDTALAEAKMELRDAPGPGERTMLSHGRRRNPGLNDDVSSLIVQYAPNLLTGQGYVYETSPRTVSSVGSERKLTHDLIRDRTSADIYACYKANMLRDPDVVDGAAVHEGGRTLLEADVVNVTSTPLQLAGVDRKIISISKASGRQTLAHRRYDPADYTYTPGTLPPLQTIDSTTEPPADPTGLVLSTGTTLTDGAFITWADGQWNRNTDDTARYYVRYRQVGTAAWSSFSVPQPDSGATVTTRVETHLPTTMIFEVQVQAEDAWDNKSAWSPVVPLQITIAADPSPATPTGLTLSTGIEPSPAQDGSYLAWIEGTWNRNTESDILQYNAQAKIFGTAIWQSIGSMPQGASDPVMRRTGLSAGIVVDVRVQAQDRDGHTSAFSSVVTITAATMATVPATPSNLIATAGPTTVRLVWDRVVDPAMSHYEIHESASNGFSISGTGETGSGTCIAHSGGASHVRAFPAGTSYPITRYYRVVAVRTGSLRSASSAQASATCIGVATGDIGSGQVQSGNIGTGSVQTGHIGTGQVQTGNIASGAVSQHAYTHGSGVVALTVPPRVELGSITMTTAGGLVEILANTTISITTPSSGAATQAVVRARNTTTGAASEESFFQLPGGSTDIALMLSVVFQEQPSAGTYTWVLEGYKASDATVQSINRSATFKEFLR